jgi:hypothetical protein
MLKDIVEARPLDGYRIYLRFDDGAEGEVDLSQLLAFRGVFASLRDPEEVRKVAVHPELGTICWPNGADLNPDVLYSHVTGQAIDADLLRSRQGAGVPPEDSA